MEPSFRPELDVEEAPLGMAPMIWLSFVGDADAGDKRVMARTLCGFDRFFLCFVRSAFPSSISVLNDIVVNSIPLSTASRLRFNVDVCHYKF
jgi:hypothetical protein